MSLIYKHHLVLPYFRIQETITQTQPNSAHTSCSKSKQKSAKIPPRRVPAHLIKTSMDNFPIEDSITQPDKQLSIKMKKLPQLTSRNKKQSDDQTLQDYLQHIKVMSARKQPNELINKLITEHSIPSAQLITEYAKFRKVEKSEKKITILDAVKNPNAQLYLKFSQQIYQLTHNLHLLKEYLNNSRKLFQVVRSLIGIRKNLFRILIKQDEDELVEFSDISRLCCIREQLGNGEQKYIDKFDLTLMDDLIYMSESIENLLLQTELTAIKRISDNIVSEEDQVHKLQKQLKKSNQNFPLSIESASMQRYQPHQNLESIELRLGQFQMIPRQVRQTSMVLGDVIKKLQQMN